MHPKQVRTRYEGGTKKRVIMREKVRGLMGELLGGKMCREVVVFALEDGEKN